MATPSSSATETRRAVIEQTRSVVVKVGTRVITTDNGQLDRRRIDLLSAQLCRIADTGRQTLMVSSGAVGAGLGKLGLENRPSGLAQLQAIAAVGQTDLIQAYETSLSKLGRHAAQVLLTAADLRRRSGYLNVRNALTQIHSYGAIAIINENDSVAVSELMTTFGDNDRLASLVAGLLSDAMLIILSDVDGLYDGPPSDPASKRLEMVETIDDRILGDGTGPPEFAKQRRDGQQVGGCEGRHVTRPTNDHRAGTGRSGAGQDLCRRANRNAVSDPRPIDSRPPTLDRQRGQGLRRPRLGSRRRQSPLQIGKQSARHRHPVGQRFVPARQRRRDLRSRRT